MPPSEYPVSHGVDHPSYMFGLKAPTTTSLLSTPNRGSLPPRQWLTRRTTDMLPPRIKMAFPAQCGVFSSIAMKANAVTTIPSSSMALMDKPSLPRTLSGNRFRTFSLKPTLHHAPAFIKYPPMTSPDASDHGVREGGCLWQLYNSVCKVPAGEPSAPANINLQNSTSASNSSFSRSRARRVTREVRNCSCQIFTGGKPN